MWRHAKLGLVRNIVIFQPAAAPAACELAQGGPHTRHTCSPSNLHQRTIFTRASKGDHLLEKGGLKIALRGGWHRRPAKERGGGGVQKWASVPGPLFCVRMVVATKGAGTQILARKIFFIQEFSPTYV